MQLPPRSSSSYTVIPEKSFHLCQTCTLSGSCACTHKKGAPPARVNTHSHLAALTHCRLFLPPPVSPLSALHGNTTPSRHVQICSSIQLTVQSLSVSVQITSSSPHTFATVAPARHPAHLFKITVPKHRQNPNSATQLCYSGAGKRWVAGCRISVERALKLCHFTNICKCVLIIYRLTIWAASLAVGPRWDANSAVS